VIGSITVDTVMEEILPATDPYGRLLVAAAVNPIDIDRAVKLDKLSDALISDVAHFHNREVLRASAALVKKISSDFIAGNIGTAEAALEAISAIDRVESRWNEGWCWRRIYMYNTKCSRRFFSNRLGCGKR
jgi:IMP dehydrogenase